MTKENKYLDVLLEPHLKTATLANPLSAVTASGIPEIQATGASYSNVATALKILVDAGVVAKVSVKLHDPTTNRMSFVAYYWKQEKLKESLPKRKRNFGKRRTPIEPVERRETPREDPKQVRPNLKIIRKHEHDDNFVSLNIGGKLFTAPEGARSSLLTNQDGSLMVTFTLPPTGN